MSKFANTALLMAGVICTAFLGVAQQPKPIIKTVPLHQTSPASGQEMYANYCASCHGAKATGNGPAAPALKTPPPNLTLLSQKNGGVFPTAHIQAVLQMGVASPAHGSSEMPVWGNLLLDLNASSQNDGAMMKQRVYNLTNYLKLVKK